MSLYSHSGWCLVSVFDVQVIETCESLDVLKLKDIQTSTRGVRFCTDKSIGWEIVWPTFGARLPSQYILYQIHATNMAYIRRRSRGHLHHHWYQLFLASSQCFMLAPVQIPLKRWAEGLGCQLEPHRRRRSSALRRGEYSNIQQFWPQFCDIHTFYRAGSGCSEWHCSGTGQRCWRIRGLPTCTSDKGTAKNVSVYGQHEQVMLWLVRKCRWWVARGKGTPAYTKGGADRAKRDLPPMQEENKCQRVAWSKLRTKMARLNFSRFGRR